MQEDTGSCRFHPDMKSLIGMPILVNDNIQCAIYLTDKNGGEPFTDNDEFILKMFSRDIEHVLERTGLMQALQKDITDRKLAEIELNNSHMELKEAYKRLKNTQDQLLQSEKMASIGQLAAGVAHEINNPVAFVYSNLSTMQKYTGKLLDVLDTYKKADPFLSACPEDVSNEIQQIKEQVDLNFIVEDLPELVSESREGLSRVKQIVQDLKDFSRVDSAEVEWADLHNGLDSTLNIVNNEIKYKAEVVKEYGELPQVECRASQINQVFLNLLVNAGHAIEKQGTITIKTGAKDEWVWIEIADTGKGILPEDMNKLFEPFFTTKPMGTGTGLGLSLSYGIVNAHEGRIEVESEVGKGTTFTVWLPVKQEDKHGDLDNETQASAIA
jgi:signal transduction histidine kinase